MASLPAIGDGIASTGYVKFSSGWLEMASVLASPDWLMLLAVGVGGWYVIFCYSAAKCGTRPISFGPALAVTSAFGCGGIPTFFHLKKLHGNSTRPQAYSSSPSPSPRVRSRLTLLRPWQSYGRSISLRMPAEPTVTHISAPQCGALLVTHLLTLSPTFPQTKESFFLKARTS